MADRKIYYGTGETAECFAVAIFYIFSRENKYSAICNGTIK
jgi:hypothetical protein